MGGQSNGVGAPGSGRRHYRGHNPVLHEHPGSALVGRPHDPRLLLFLFDQRAKPARSLADLTVILGLP